MKSRMSSLSTPYTWNHAMMKMLNDSLVPRLCKAYISSYMLMLVKFAVAAAAFNAQKDKPVHP